MRSISSNCCVLFWLKTGFWVLPLQAAVGVDGAVFVADPVQERKPAPPAWLLMLLK